MLSLFSSIFGKTAVEVVAEQQKKEAEEKIKAQQELYRLYRISGWCRRDEKPSLYQLEVNYFPGYGGRWHTLGSFTTLSAAEKALAKRRKLDKLERENPVIRKVFKEVPLDAE